MKTLIISFLLIVAAQLVVPVKMIHDKQAPLIYGQEFTFKTQPIDPYDPFRGKYVTLSFADNYIEVDGGEKWEKREIVYLEFVKGEDGFAKIKSIAKEVPKNSKFYLKSTVSRVVTMNAGKKKKVVIYYPFRRYYMEESKAESAERLARNSSRDNSYDVSVVVNLYKGGASIKKLQVDDVPMEEAVKKHNLRIH